ncbi:MAG: cellobiose 2-epimerase [Firmicutes bacterium]|nr:cellobiose 2-epimerase [Bacillota bacterium]
MLILFLYILIRNMPCKGLTCGGGFVDKKPNRLIEEKSPYLLQHAYNPVEWYPWGEEAFAKAREEDKPVFFSSGYSTCHWCHVMERESFEAEDVALVLNEKFVAIKVDREERPDVDAIYMSVCQALTRSGGWPLTVIMTPNKKPFFAGTYFPKHSMGGRPGLLDILAAVADEWANNRERLIQNGEDITAAIQGRTVRNVDGASKLNTGILELGYSQLEAAFDAEYGGFGHAPKFPSPHNLMFLLRYWQRTGEEKALSMVLKTLEAMHQGGIYDHLGYGFSRYSTDRRWLVPHFEKMLYDNALLCCAYLEAYQCSGEWRFAKVAEEIVQYVLRDMTNHLGAFYSAEDADSEGEEGKFYVWTRREIFAALGEKDGEIFADYYNATPEGNFEQGASILNLIGMDRAKFAQKRGLSEAEVKQILRQGREKLFQLRDSRVHPFKDDKILTAWNALMIVALAKTAKVLDRPQYAAVAGKVVKFIFTNLMREDGRLLARYRVGQADYLAYLDDYAFLLWALVEVYGATYSTEYLNKATKLSKEMIKLFWDEKEGGFYFYGADGETLIARPKELYDGAMPSGNSVAALAFLKLGRLCSSEELMGYGEKALITFVNEAAAYPQAYTFFLLALDYYLEPPRQVVVAGNRGDSVTEQMLRVLGASFLPTTDILLNDMDNNGKIVEILPHIAEKAPVDGRASAYICQNFTCQAPIVEVEALQRML